MTRLNKAATRSTDDIASDLDDLIDQGRELLAEVLETTGKRSSSLRSTFDDVGGKVAQLQTTATRAAQRGMQQGGRLARQTDRYMRDNPWQAIAGALAMGIVATWWWNQRR